MDRSLFIAGGLTAGLIPFPVTNFSVALPSLGIDNVMVDEAISILPTMTPQWEYGMRAQIDGKDHFYYELFEGSPNQKDIDACRVTAPRRIARAVATERRSVA